MIHLSKVHDNTRTRGILLLQSGSQVLSASSRGGGGGGGCGGRGGGGGGGDGGVQSCSTTEGRGEGVVVSTVECFVRSEMRSLVYEFEEGCL